VLAAAGGHLRVVEWLYQRQMPDLHDHDTCSFPLRVSQLLGFRQSSAVNWLDNLLVVATFHGHLHILQWLRKLDEARFDDYFFDACSWPYNWVLLAGHTEILYWLHTFQSSSALRW
jgi:hypothetical protein